jgi:hypothetical protein
MRLYFVIHDTHPTPQTPTQHQEQMTNWRTQPFARVVSQRRTGPNEQLSALKTDPTGAFRLGGIDVLDNDIRASLDVEARRIDGRFSQPHRQLELVLLEELRAALPSDDTARANDLTVTVVAWGTRSAALTGIRSYLQTNAAVWYESA